MSDLDELVQRCKQGELAAFTRLFRDHEAWLYRLAVTILQNERDAEDALQDAYIRIFERIKAFQGKSALETWMTAIMVNVCRDRLRRRQVRRALPLDCLQHGHAIPGGRTGFILGLLFRGACGHRVIAFEAQRRCTSLGSNQSACK